MDKEKTIDYIKETTSNLGLGNVKSVEPLNNNLQPHKKRFLASTKRKKYLFKFYDGVIRENLGFLQYLNSVDFPTQRIYIPDGLPPIPDNGCIIYEYLGRVMKNSISFDETMNVSRLIARLHEESDNYTGKSKSKVGLTHGDLKLQNIIFVEGYLHLIDFEKMKERPYVADVTGYLFYNTLSDLSSGLILSKDATKRANSFREIYEECRDTKLGKESFSKYLMKHSQWFNNWIIARMKNKNGVDRNLSEKIKLIGTTLEVLLSWH